MRVKSLKNKISLINVVILAVVLSGYTALVYVLMNNLALRQIDKELTVEVQEIRDLLDSFLSRPASTVTTIQIASSQVIAHHELTYSVARNDILARRILDTVDRYELRNNYVALLDPAGRTIVLSQSVSPELESQFLKTFVSAKSRSVYADVMYHNKPLRLYATTIRLKNGDDYVIMMATSLRDAGRITKIIFAVSFMVIPFVLVLAWLIGRWLAVSVLKPVAVVAQMADEISYTDLSRRITVQDADDEMKHLVQSFNGMIERLERSFQHISEFSAHTAHELKTPLAVIRGESELALRRERSPEEYRQALRTNVRDSERMIQVVDDMLTLSRLEHDPQCLNFKPLEFGPFIKDIHEKAKLLAEKKEIVVSLTAPQDGATFMADENALRRAFLNILDNAVKFTPERGQIKISVGIEKSSIRARISDTGRGIPEDELPKIFEKFYHKDPSASVPGNGLGLSIVLSIVRAHQGDVRVDSRVGQGATFSVTLPLQK